MIVIITIIFFALGLIIGSFLNVVIYRINTKKSLGGRSACMSCRNQLQFFELVPVFSFLGLKGRCRNCKTKISLQYPIVEFLTGVIFASLFLKFSAQGGSASGGQEILAIFQPEFIITYLYYAAMFSLLLVVVVYDFKHKIIPDTLSFTFGLLALLGLFLFPAFHIPLLSGFLSGLFIALPFYLLWLVSRGAWMGLGDAKLAVGLGWFLGFSVALSALVLAFWIGTIIGLGLIFFKKGYGMKSEIPFAPYLVLGTFIAFIFQLNIFHIYF
ncbi:MAG TPA: prepilin peptidase [Candidatus Paceibacterota bacterium]|jgi:leader peptidase (prepilin peptidase)/N-methyltransferase|nr:prepilin peptidase [Candidatus Paceibacterota bacterium]